MVEGEQLRIEGVVQGVGFRPFVWQQAQLFSISGCVRNEGGGVVVELWGTETQRNAFVNALQQHPPVLARVDSLTRCPLPHNSPADDFTIDESRSAAVTSILSADAAICPDCVRELSNPKDRRYRYPLINCTHCGPRYSIAEGLPYDRQRSSMRRFTLCETCAEEYASPQTRRFHAQATACPQCGPAISLLDRDGQLVVTGDAMARCAQLLAEGKLIAIKGIGGFHLACDATNSEVVMRLRQRKQRPHKPFAVMVRDIAAAHAIAEIGEAEAAALQSAAAPIVLLEKKRGSELSEAIAPGLNSVGCMLAYSGVHAMLLDALQRPLVMTSANRHGELLLCDNSEALTELAEIADYFLLHDREIVHRQDDSVVKLIAGKPRLLRRARGYVPGTIPLPQGLEGCDGVLAMGGDLKNSFCLLHQGRAVLSPYGGDLGAVSNFSHYKKTISGMSAFLAFTPRHIAVDAHPNYRSSGYGTELSRQTGRPLTRVYHHHAHIAACMLEHGVSLNTRKVLGIALDGLGYGEDGTLWGGEFLLADYAGFRRVAAFDAVPLPGGDAANREPWRNAFAHLHHSLGWDSVVQRYATLDVIAWLQSRPLSQLTNMIERQLNSPLSSSCGRLFDAAAALLGICVDGISYEGQAAIELEQLAAVAFASEDAYPVKVDEEDELARIQWGGMWRALLDDLAAGWQESVLPLAFTAAWWRPCCGRRGRLFCAMI